MFVMFLKFAENRDRAAAHMDGHNAWLKRGFDEDVFLLAGSLQPKAGGGILAHNTTREALEVRAGEDPFVAEGIVTAEIHEITPGRVDDRLAFLQG